MTAWDLFDFGWMIFVSIVVGLIAGREARHWFHHWRRIRDWKKWMKGPEAQRLIEEAVAEQDRRALGCQAAARIVKHPIDQVIYGPKKD